jgi:Holliday junction DNA helicase RuvB
MKKDEYGLLSPRREEGDEGDQELNFEASIRPKSLDNYVGQEKLKTNLKIFIEAAKARGDSLDHVLFHGPPGIGKTTLAHIISHEMEVSIKATSGPVIERPGDLAAILTNLQDKDVLFIDEIHRLNHVVEEILYPAMEDFKLDLIIGQGPSARIIKLDLPSFTLIGATTRAGLLTSPLRDRFGMISRLDFYNPKELQLIIERSARIFDIEVDKQVKAQGFISEQVAQKALDLLEVDQNGLDKMDRKLLSTIIEKFGGGPVGIETLSAAINEEKDTIEDVYEPYLLQEGFIDRTPRGRVVTPLAYKHLGHEIKRPTEESP